MSGIAALYRRDGAVIEPQMLETMSQRLAIRGPDSRQVWACGSFGLVHTYFATDGRGKSDQPFSLDGQIWVTADARIDARKDLIGRLGSRRDLSVHSSDAELIWHAYQAWGEQCAQHLLGDFAFVIADMRANRLVCARDQVGVKPLFYAASDEWIVVSNLLECVRTFKFVDDCLNDSFILDFLLHGWNTDVTRTAFQAIHRLAPAHVMECTPAAIRHRRYWAPNVPTEDTATSIEDHVERFTELFQAAVSDRLRNQPACVSFSGGKDSTTTAATAWHLLSGHSDQPALTGICAVYDRILPDQERRYATLASQRLGMPLDFVVCDDLPVFDTDWDMPAGQTPEPSFRTNAVRRRIAQKAIKRSRIILSGVGGDEALRPPVRYYQKLLREARWLRWAMDCVRHLWTLHTLPPVGFRTLLYKRAWARATGKSKAVPTFPNWVNPELVRKHSLNDRWEQFWRGDDTLTDSRKPGGLSSLAGCLMPNSLSSYDVSTLHVPHVEYRYPYLDLRLIEYCWSIPPIPLRFEKELLQRAFADRLPQEVLRRRKQGLAGDPLLAKTVRVPVPWEECVSRTPELSRYVTSNPAPGGDFSKFNTFHMQAALAPFELESWMHNRWRSGH